MSLLIRLLARLGLYPVCVECGEPVTGRRSFERGTAYHPDCLENTDWWAETAMTDDRSYVQSPQIESGVTCGHCGVKWWYEFDPSQEHYEIECPGCGATWSTGNA